MSRSTVAGVFGSMQAARDAEGLLVEAGVAPGRITLSKPLTADGIAAEAPGESYENQPGEADGEATAQARFDEGVRSGVCVLSVDADTDHEAIVELLQRAGARNTTRHLT